MLGVGNDVLKNRPDAVKLLVASWFDALEYVKKHQAESFKIMAKASGVSVAEFTEMWKGVRIPTLAENQAALGTAPGSGSYRKTVESMSSFMIEQKLITQPVAADSMVSGAFLPAK